MSRRSTIMAAVSDLAVNFMYYDRKDDGELPEGEIQSAVESGEITVDEICRLFAASLAGHFS